MCAGARQAVVWGTRHPSEYQRWLNIQGLMLKISAMINKDKIYYLNSRQFKSWNIYPSIPKRGRADQTCFWKLEGLQNEYNLISILSFNWRQTAVLTSKVPQKVQRTVPKINRAIQKTTSLTALRLCKVYTGINPMEPKNIQKVWMGRNGERPLKTVQAAGYKIPWLCK